MKVLVIDDNETSRRIFKEMLGAFSFDVDLAESAREGIAALIAADQKTPFDLVVMDWKMPEMDGLEAAQRIKGHGGLNRIPPIILVTAYPREEIMRRSEAIGLDGFLIKPVNSSVLFDAIMHVFEPRSTGEAVSDHRPGDTGERIDVLTEARILLVEDNEINQQVAREILESAGLIVSVAGDGQAAVERVRAEAFDAVLMDVQMPIMDGYSATREIRKDERFETLPIIAMTAHAMAGDADKSLACGMNGHITKPIEPDRMFAELAKWVGSRTRTDDAPPAKGVNKQATVLDDKTLPEILNGFDLTEGLKRLQGNQMLYRKLIISFAESCRDALDQIRTAISRQDWEAVHHQAHSLKGSSGNLAADDVHAAAQALEKLVKNNSDRAPSEAARTRCLGHLDREVNIILSAVAGLGGSAKTVVPTAGDAFAGIPEEKHAALASRMKSAAEIGDVIALQTIADELESEFGDKQGLSRRIVELADNFDFDHLIELADRGSP